MTRKHGYRECIRCHCLRPVAQLDTDGRCLDWPRCQARVNGSTGPQTKVPGELDPWGAR